MFLIKIYTTCRANDSSLARKRVRLSEKYIIISFGFIIQVNHMYLQRCPGNLTKKLGKHGAINFT